MIGKSSTAFASLLGLLALSGCGGSESVSQQTSSPAVTTKSSSESAPSVAAGSDTKHTILKSGFGVDGGYAWVATLVRNDSENVGATVIAHFNLLDKAGEIAASTDQTESFSRAGETLTLGTQVDIPRGTKPVKVEVTVQVDYPGIGPDTEFPELLFTPVKVVKSEYGGWEASSVLTNTTPEALNSPRIGVVCLNAAGDIIGGSSVFPDLVPPNGKTRVVTNSLIMGGKPAKCEMRAGAPL
jgi:hypothetical protein